MPAHVSASRDIKSPKPERETIWERPEPWAILTLKLRVPELDLDKEFVFIEIHNFSNPIRHLTPLFRTEEGG